MKRVHIVATARDLKGNPGYVVRAIIATKHGTRQEDVTGLLPLQDAHAKAAELDALEANR